MPVPALLVCELVVVIRPSGELEEREDGSKGERRPEVEDARGLREEVYQREWESRGAKSGRTENMVAFVLVRLQALFRIGSDVGWLLVDKPRAEF